MTVSRHRYSLHIFPGCSTLFSQPASCARETLGHRAMLQAIFLVNEKGWFLL